MMQLLVLLQFTIVLAYEVHVESGSTSKSIVIDATSNTEATSFVHGTDLGPLCLGYPPFDDSNPRFSGPDVSTDMHELGITVVRTHDSSLLDWPVYFPHPDLDVDTNDPANYDFSQGDAWLSSILDNGFEPYFRLGASFNFQGGGLPSNPTEVNLTALADVLLHTVMHYRDGWGSNGSYPGYHNIKYWEIWNEPDSSCDWSNSESCGQFWNRTSAELIDLVDKTVRAIKAYDDSLIVGANGCALPYAPWETEKDNPYSWGLIDEMASRKTPIDFFSWHYYTDNTDLMTEISTAVRAKLDSVGLTHVRQHVTEWNICMNCMEQDTVLGAASTVTTMINMIQNRVELATFYPACVVGEGEAAGHGWGLFDQDTTPGIAMWRLMTYGYQYFADLINTTPMLISSSGVVIQPEQSSNINFAVLAGQATGTGDNMYASIKVLLTSKNETTHDSTQDVSICITNVIGSSWQYIATVIDDTHTNETLVTGKIDVAVDRSLHVTTFAMSSVSVVYVQLTQVS